ncbi:MAG: class II glutamine amidotransferase [Acidobacteriota bacterium]
MLEESDKFRDECGVFGICGHPEAARHTYLGLYGLQHRGQESAGIATSDGRGLNRERGMGYVADVFKETTLERLPGESAIGHVRYSTTGDSTSANAQPILTESWRGPIAIAHNGNLINTKSLRKQLEADGAIFQSTSDTEVILHLLARSHREDLDDALVDTLRLVRGAFSLLMLTPQALYAVRDPYGVRPLCLGKMNGAYVVASETCAFDLIGASYIRDVVPGEILRIQGTQLLSVNLGPTFIEPKQSIRHFGVKVKLNPVKELLAGRRVILIDDSIVRGTTSRKIVEMVRSAGASEVHLRISSPPTIGPCHYGIDTPTESELIANNRTLKEIQEFTTADTLGYLSLEGLRKAVDADSNFCAACFDRSYAIPVPEKIVQKELFAVKGSV